MSLALYQCLICCLTFDEEERMPRLLPCCNRTICQYCLLKNLTANTEEHLCPYDRKPLPYNEEEWKSMYAVNHQIMEFLNEATRWQICDIHNEPKKIVCMVDDKLICASCSRFSNCYQHTVVEVSSFLETATKLEKYYRGLLHEINQRDEEFKTQLKQEQDHIFEIVEEEYARSIRNAEEILRQLMIGLHRSFQKQLDLISNSMGDTSILKENLEQNIQHCVNLSKGKNPLRILDLQTRSFEMLSQEQQVLIEKILGSLKTIWKAAMPEIRSIFYQGSKDQKQLQINTFLNSFRFEEDEDKNPIELSFETEEVHNQRKEHERETKIPITTVNLQFINEEQEIAEEAALLFSSKFNCVLKSRELTISLFPEAKKDQQTSIKFKDLQTVETLHLYISPVMLKEEKNLDILRRIFHYLPYLKNLILQPMLFKLDSISFPEGMKKACEFIVLLEKKIKYIYFLQLHFVSIDCEFLRFIYIHILSNTQELQRLAIYFHNKHYTYVDFNQIFTQAEIMKQLYQNITELSLSFILPSTLPPNMQLTLAKFTKLTRLSLDFRSVVNFQKMIGDNNLALLVNSYPKLEYCSMNFKNTNVNDDFCIFLIASLKKLDAFRLNLKETQISPKTIRYFLNHITSPGLLDRKIKVSSHKFNSNLIQQLKTHSSRREIRNEGSHVVRTNISLTENYYVPLRQNESGGGGRAGDYNPFYMGNQSYQYTEENSRDNQNNQSQVFDISRVV